VFVGREIVKHDDITRSEGGHEHLFDGGQETRTVDRPIEHGGRGEALEPKRGADRVRLPVPAGRVIAQARAARTPPVPTSQIRRDATFIEKHVLPYIPEGLPVAPATALSDDVGATLFLGVYRFF
jgi:hypothetical protein